MPLILILLLLMLLELGTGGGTELFIGLGLKLASGRILCLPRNPTSLGSCFRVTLKLRLGPPLPPLGPWLEEAVEGWLVDESPLEATFPSFDVSFALIGVSVSLVSGKPLSPACSNHMAQHSTV